MTRKWCFFFAMFLFLSVVPLNATCGLYTYQDVLMDGSGNTIGDNYAQASCYQSRAYAEAHVRMPSGAQVASSASGSTSAEALTQSPASGEEGNGEFWGFSEASSACFDAFNSFPFDFPITVGFAFTKMLTSPPGQSDSCNSVPICSNTATPKCKFSPILEVGGGACHPAHDCEGLAVRINDGPYSCWINVCIPNTNTSPSPSCTPLLQ